MLEYMGSLLTIPTVFTAIDTLGSSISSDSFPIYLTVLSSIAACFSSFFALKSIQRTSDASKSQVLFTAMDHYLRTLKDRRRAEISNRSELCKDYYLEMFSVLWTEYQCYKLDYIDRDTMRIWMEVANKRFISDKFSIEDKNGGIVTISCKDVWDELLRDKYYTENDTFVEFMENVRRGNIDKALDESIKSTNKGFFNEGIFSRSTGLPVRKKI